MAWLQAIILGLVQGLAEFLPISSSGHLVLLQHLFGIDDGGLLLDVMLHIGTLVAVCIVYRKRIWDMIRHPFQPQVLYIIIATIPAVLVTLLLGDRIDAAFASVGGSTGFCFLLTSVFLLFAAMRQNRKGHGVRMPNAIIMGIFQALAILPAVSRSGSTITGGLMSGVDRDEAADFSFLMSIPAIAGAFVMQIPDILSGQAFAQSTIPLPAVLLGMAVAAAAGYAAIRVMLYVIRHVSLRWFALYTAVLGVFIILDANFMHLFF